MTSKPQTPLAPASSLTSSSSSLASSTSSSLSADGEGAALLYALDLRADHAQGRSYGPAGVGSAAADVDVVVPFHYRVRLDVVDGVPGLRFPLQREQPGGGDYAQFFVVVVARGPRLLRGQRRLRWSVHLPDRLALGARGPHHENRLVFSYGLENRRLLLGLRFDGDDALMWAAEGRDLARAPLARRVRPGARLTFAAGVDFDARNVVVTAADDDGPLVATAAPAGLPVGGDALCMLSGANGVSESNDPRLFFRLLDATIEAGGIDVDVPPPRALPAR
jgi:hypothetical protein